VRQSESVPAEQVSQVLWQGKQVWFEELAYVPSGQTGTQIEVEVFK